MLSFAWNRIYIGAKIALEKELKNVAFLRTRIDFIDDYFGKNEVDEIWLTFSDPQPKKPKKPKLHTTTLQEGSEEEGGWRVVLCNFGFFIFLGFSPGFTACAPWTALVLLFFLLRSNQ